MPNSELLTFLYFNTSNVTIQRQHFRMRPRHCSISIHLMLLFNNRNSSFAVVFIAISIHLMLLFNCLACYFFAVNVCDFNTSNVTIQPKFQHHRKGLYLNFNTSNVTIQLSLSSPTMSFLYISIHLMLLFNS